MGGGEISGSIHGMCNDGGPRISTASLTMVGRNYLMINATESIYISLVYLGLYK